MNLKDAVVNDTKRILIPSDLGLNLLISQSSKISRTTGTLSLKDSTNKII